MMTHPTLTRRTLLASAAALPLAAATPSLAAAPMLGASTTAFNRFKLGAFEVTTLLSNTVIVPGPHDIFGMNVDPETFNKVSAEANLPTDKARFYFTPTVVNTGTELVLFDTGQSPDLIVTALVMAGYGPDQIDVVVITHMHGDHIGGLMGPDGATFPNARYVTGTVEFDAWNAAGDDKFNSNMKPLADKTTMLDAGGDVVSGITSIAAFGHTPGHMVYHIESNGQRLLIGGDFTNHYVWSLAHPDWEVKFDMDKTTAAATRVQLLDMLSADKLPFVGYHMPWPGLGYASKHRDGYVYVPESYQLQLTDG